MVEQTEGVCQMSVPHGRARSIWGGRVRSIIPPRPIPEAGDDHEEARGIGRAGRDCWDDLASRSPWRPSISGSGGTRARDEWRSAVSRDRLQSVPRLRLLHGVRPVRRDPRSLGPRPRIPEACRWWGPDTYTSRPQRPRRTLSPGRGGAARVGACRVAGVRRPGVPRPVCRPLRHAASARRERARR